MRNFLKVLTVSVMLASSVFAQEKPAQNHSEAAKPPAESIDPCNDFYAYACSKWKAQNPIPADRPSWGRFDELQQRGEFIVRDILEKESANRPDRISNEQKIGDYYASCMDESAIEKAGTKPLEQDFQSIGALKTKEDLTKEIVRLHGEGVDVLFAFDSGSDFKNASQIIAQVDQGGLGMPDRDYYFKDDPKSVELRKKYVEHWRRCLSSWATIQPRPRQRPKSSWTLKPGWQKARSTRPAAAIRRRSITSSPIRNWPR
jgi:putative endopeptidase